MLGKEVEQNMKVESGVDLAGSGWIVSEYLEEKQLRTEDGAHSLIWKRMTTTATLLEVGKARERRRYYGKAMVAYTKPPQRSKNLYIYPN